VSERSLPEQPLSDNVLPVRYEWDNAKEASNWRKHGVMFMIAIATGHEQDRYYTGDRENR
jgi:uncharacterized DUF497 family protein